ncbi:hypothetical protein L5515_009287 [Caenorhabditis briggsae]|uniref:DUF7154 domain-containing protein n=3 Tax=Caenorhabditis briggsae TaxID=6238 RepID=A0AAE9FB50_CAEBR|nr:hypothetical protein L5515_009287 [Caenorhabditis briggsae]
MRSFSVRFCRPDVDGYCQNHTLDGSFISVNYTIQSFDGSWQLTGPGVDSGYNQEGTGIIAFPQLNGSTSYTWTIDYHYAGNEPQFILARIYYYILLSRLPSILLNPAFVFHFLKMKLVLGRLLLHSFLPIQMILIALTLRSWILILTEMKLLRTQHMQISMNQSVYNHLPNPKLGYGNSRGSNVLNIIQRFLDNDQAPICGSTLFIMVKRYPNENDVHDLITQLRNNHVFVYFSVNDTPSGGNNPRALFDLSMYTNGYCVFSRFTGDVATYSTDVFDETYQIVAQNFVVSGSGRIELPLFKFPEPYPGEWQNFITWMITIQSHVLDSDFITLNYTFASTDGTSVLTDPDPNIDTISGLMGTGYSGWTELNGTNEYKWTIDYKYAGNEPQVIEVRLYNRNYQDFLPLPDY